MDMISEGQIRYPEWFKLERGTEKTVNRLSRIEELRFYLRSPDQYFRRLAILRINQLRLKDGISYLEEMLDNDLESELNKKLAAWTIKSICLKWNVDLFISNRLFYQFSGKEQYDEMYSINIEDSCPPLHLKIPSSPVSEKITWENNDIKHMQELGFETSFFFSQWLKAYLSDLVTVGKEGVRNLPFLILSLVQKLPKISLSVLFNKGKGILSWHQRNSGRKKRKLFYFPARNYPGTFIREVLSRIMHVICYPFKLICLSKVRMVGLFCLIYYYLTFTGAGIFLTAKCFGVSLIDLQNNLLKTDLMETRDEIYVTAKKILLIAWMQLKDIADWLYIKWIEGIGVNK
jgi:hypothetical protein